RHLNHSATSRFPAALARAPCLRPRSLRFRSAAQVAGLWSSIGSWHLRVPFSLLGHSSFQFLLESLIFWHEVQAVVDVAPAAALLGEDEINRNEIGVFLRFTVNEPDAVRVILDVAGFFQVG